MIRRHQITCYLSRASLDELKQQARAEGISLSAWIRQIISANLVRNPAEAIEDLADRMLFATLALEALLGAHADKGLYEQVTKAWHAAREDGGSQ
jgi:hypothetical protein